MNINYGNATWKVLNINSEEINDTNDSSIVIELSYYNTKYLFMGDSTTEVENSRNWEDIDVLKVGHHGANTSTSQEFLNQIKPEYAIISVGENDYGHPSDEVLEKLKDVITYRTDRDNTIWITSDGQSIRVEELNYNLDGNGRKQAYIFERKYYMLAFFTT